MNSTSVNKDPLKMVTFPGGVFRGACDHHHLPRIKENMDEAIIEHHNNNNRKPPLRSVIFKTFKSRCSVEVAAELDNKYRLYNLLDERARLVLGEDGEQVMGMAPRQASPQLNTVLPYTTPALQPPETLQRLAAPTALPDNLSPEERLAALQAALTDYHDRATQMQEGYEARTQAQQAEFTNRLQEREVISEQAIRADTDFNSQCPSWTALYNYVYEKYSPILSMHYLDLMTNFKRYKQASGQSVANYLFKRKEFANELHRAQPSDANLMDANNGSIAKQAALDGALLENVRNQMHVGMENKEHTYDQWEEKVLSWCKNVQKSEEFQQKPNNTQGYNYGASYDEQSGYVDDQEFYCYPMGPPQQQRNGGAPQRRPTYGPGSLPPRGGKVFVPNSSPNGGKGFNNKGKGDRRPGHDAHNQSLAKGTPGDPSRGPPPSPCKNCGGDHWRNECTAPPAPAPKSGARTGPPSKTPYNKDGPPQQRADRGATRPPLRQPEMRPAAPATQQGYARPSTGDNAAPRKFVHMAFKVQSSEETLPSIAVKVEGLPEASKLDTLMALGDFKASAHQHGLLDTPEHKTFFNLLTQYNLARRSMMKHPEGFPGGPIAKVILQSNPLSGEELMTIEAFDCIYPCDGTDYDFLPYATLKVDAEFAKGFTQIVARAVGLPVPQEDLRLKQRHISKPPVLRRAGRTAHHSSAASPPDAFAAATQRNEPEADNTPIGTAAPLEYSEAGCVHPLGHAVSLAQLQPAALRLFTQPPEITLIAASNDSNSVVDSPACCKERERLNPTISTLAEPQAELSPAKCNIVGYALAAIPTANYAEPDTCNLDPVGINEEFILGPDRSWRPAPVPHFSKADTLELNKTLWTHVMPHFAKVTTTMKSSILLLDTGATVKICTEQWAIDNYIHFHNVQALDTPACISTGAGIIKCHFKADLSLYLFDANGVLNHFIYSDVFLSRGKVIHCILAGGDVIRKNRYNFTINMHSGVVAFNGGTIKFEVTKGNHNCMLVHPIIQDARLDPYLEANYKRHPHRRERPRATLGDAIDDITQAFIVNSVNPDLEALAAIMTRTGKTTARVDPTTETTPSAGRYIGKTVHRVKSPCWGSVKGKAGKRWIIEWSDSSTTSHKLPIVSLYIASATAINQADYNARCAEPEHCDTPETAEDEVPIIEAPPSDNDKDDTVSEPGNLDNTDQAEAEELEDRQASDDENTDQYVDPADQSKYEDVIARKVVRVQLKSTKQVTYMQPEVFANFISSIHLYLGHGGITMVIRLLRPTFDIRYLREFVTATIKECDACARFKPKVGRAIKYVRKRPYTVNSRVSMDLVMFNCDSIKGYRYILHIQDLYSNYSICIPIKQKIPSAVRNAFQRYWDIPLGRPKEVLVDGGTEFLGEFDAYLKQRNIPLLKTPVGHPQSNGGNERLNGEISVIVNLMLHDRCLPQECWADMVMEGTDKMNDRPRESDGKTPYQLFFARPPRPLPPVEDLEELVQTENYDKLDVSLVGFKPGDCVLYRHPNQYLVKLAMKYKPHVVIKQITPRQYLIQSLEQQTSAPVHGHINHMKIDPSEIGVNGIEKYLKADILKIIATSDLGPDFPELDTAAPEPAQQEPVKVGDLILWVMDDLRSIHLGRVTVIEDGFFEAHAYGTYQSRTAISRKKFLPSWIHSGDGKAIFANSRANSDKWSAELCVASLSTIICYGFALDGKFLSEPARKAAAVKILQGYNLLCHLPNGVPEVDYADFISNEMNNMTQEVIAYAMAAETTHQDYKRRELSPEELVKADAARAKELSKFEEFGVFERVPLNKCAGRSIPTKWVETLKLDDTGARKYKARLVARGDLDHRTGLATTTGSCSAETIRILLLLAQLGPNWHPGQLQSIDVESAYLQSDVIKGASTFLQPPKDHPDRNQFVWKLRKAVYGLADAGNLFEKKLHSVMKQLGYKRSVLDGVFLLKDKGGQLLGVVAHYVDDCLLIGFLRDATTLANDISALLKTTATKEVSLFVGVHYTAFQDRVECHQHPYIMSIECEEGATPDQPLPNGVAGDVDNSKLLPEALKTRYRKVLGQLMYAANNSMPAASFAASFFSRCCNEPTFRAWRLLNSAVRYFKSIAESHKIVIRPLVQNVKGVDVIEFVSHVDASFGSSLEPYSQTGYIVFHNGSPLLWASHKQKRVSRSTCKAEIVALDECVDHVCLIRDFFTEVGITVRISVHTDAQNVCNLLAADHPRPTERTLITKLRQLNDKTIVVAALSLFDSIDENRVSVIKIDTKLNIADALTKPMPVDAILATMLDHGAYIVTDDSPEADPVNFTAPRLAITNTSVATQAAVSSRAATATPTSVVTMPVAHADALPVHDSADPTPSSPAEDAEGSEDEEDIAAPIVAPVPTWREQGRLRVNPTPKLPFVGFAMMAHLTRPTSALPSRGIPFDKSRGLPPSPCKNCGGNHWRNECNDQDYVTRKAIELVQAMRNASRQQRFAGPPPFNYNKSPPATSAPPPYYAMMMSMDRGQHKGSGDKFFNTASRRAPADYICAFCGGNHRDADCDDMRAQPTRGPQHPTTLSTSHEEWSARYQLHKQSQGRVHFNKQGSADANRNDISSRLKDPKMTCELCHRSLTLGYNNKWYCHYQSCQPSRGRRHPDAPTLHVKHGGAQPSGQRHPDAAAPTGPRRAPVTNGGQARDAPKQHSNKRDNISYCKNCGDHRVDLPTCHRCYRSPVTNGKDRNANAPKHCGPPKHGAPSKSSSKPRSAPVADSQVRYASGKFNYVQYCPECNLDYINSPMCPSCLGVSSRHNSPDQYCQQCLIPPYWVDFLQAAMRCICPNCSSKDPPNLITNRKGGPSSMKH